MDNKQILDSIRDIRTLPEYRLEEIMKHVSFQVWQHGYNSTGNLVRREINQLSMPITLNLLEMKHEDA